MLRTIPTVLVCLALATGCASRLSGDVRYDQDVDFAALKTFAFEKDLDATPEARRANVGTARAAIEKSLTAKGYRFVDRGAADVWIKIASGRINKSSSSGQAGWGTYGGIQLDMVRPDGSFLWEGWAVETWRESMDPATEIEKAVALILEQFPPS